MGKGDIYKTPTPSPNGTLPRLVKRPEPSWKLPRGPQPRVRVGALPATLQGPWVARCAPRVTVWCRSTWRGASARPPHPSARRKCPGTRGVALAPVSVPGPTRRDSRDGLFLPTKNKHCPKHSRQGSSGEPCSHPAWAPSACSSVGRLGPSVSKAAQAARLARCWHQRAHPGSARGHLQTHPSHISGAWRRLWESPKAKGPPRGGGEKLGRDLVERKCVQMEAAPQPGPPAGNECGSCPAR